MRTRRSKLFLFPFFQKEKKETLVNRRKLPPPPVQKHAHVQNALSHACALTHTHPHTHAHTRSLANAPTLRARKKKQTRGNNSDSVPYRERISGRTAAADGFFRRRWQLGEARDCVPAAYSKKATRHAFLEQDVSFCTFTYFTPTLLFSVFQRLFCPWRRVRSLNLASLTSTVFSFLFCFFTDSYALADAAVVSPESFTMHDSSNDSHLYVWCCVFTDRTVR